MGVGWTCERTDTAPSVGRPVASARRSKSMYSSSLVHREPGQIKATPITCDSFNARQSTAQRQLRIETLPVFILEQSVKSAPLIRVGTARFEGGLEEEKTY